MTRTRRMQGIALLRIVPLAALLLLLPLVFPSHAGGRKADRPAGLQAPKKEIMLSLKIAEARRKENSRRYYQSLARRMHFRGLPHRAHAHAKGPR